MGSKLIIIRGNSGSGKTTIAKSLQEKFGYNTMLISQDIVRRDILKVKDGTDTKALPLLKDLLRYGACNSNVVILEGILYSDWYLSLFQVALEVFGENVFAYYYDISFDETLQRHQTKPNKNDFGEEAMRRWWRENDYIGIIKEKILLSNMDINSTVEIITNDVNQNLRRKKL